MVSFRQAHVQDQSAVRDYLRTFYGQRFGLKYPERWKWQFIDNPFRPKGDHLPLFLAFEREKVVGQLGLQYGQVWINRECASCAWGVDFGVLPGYRGQGIGEQLQKLAAESTPYLLSASMDVSAARIKKRLGFVSGTRVRCLRRFLRISGCDLLEYLENKAQRRGSLYRAVIKLLMREMHGADALAIAVRGINYLYNSGENLVGQMNGAKIEEFEEFGPAEDTLWETCKGDHVMTTARTSLFLNWRYTKCPFTPYKKIRLVVEGLTVAFLVYRERTFPEPKSVRILDLFGRTETPAKALLVQWLLEKYCQTASFIEVAGSGYHQGVFRELGFFPMESQSPLVGGTLASSHAASLAIRGWSVTLGDHDWDQVQSLCNPAIAINTRTGRLSPELSV